MFVSIQFAISFTKMPYYQLITFEMNTKCITSMGLCITNEQQISEIVRLTHFYNTINLNLLLFLETGWLKCQSGPTAQLNYAFKMVNMRQTLMNINYLTIVSNRTKHTLEMVYRLNDNGKRIYVGKFCSFHVYLQVASNYTNIILPIQ